MCEGNRPFISQTLKPLSCLLIIHLFTVLLHLRFLCDFDQSLLSAIAHISATTHKELCASIEELHYFFSIMIQAILDVLATITLVRGLRERQSERYSSELLPALEEIGIK